MYAAPTQRPRVPESNDANREKCREVPGQRLYFLDWLRIGAFGLLVLYHVGMYYVPWPFHVKSPHLVAGLEPWMRLTEPWRMSLIFLVSGAATAHLLRDGASGRWLLLRTRFLLLPLLTGVVLIVPPQTYFEVVQKFGYHDGFLAFLGRYFSVLSNSREFCEGAGVEARCLVMPTWNHLWFLPYLWCYTVVLCGVIRFDRDAPVRPVLAEAVFPVYLVHQTVMIVLSQALVGWSLPVGVEALVLLSATGGISFGVYRLVRRQRFLRPWFGLRG